MTQTLTEFLLTPLQLSSGGNCCRLDGVDKGELVSF